MNRIEHILARIAEECDETSQRALKALVFGLTEIQPNQPEDNIQRLNREFNDLLAVVELLNDELRAQGIKNRIGPVAWMIADKREKFEKYLKHSEACGTLTPAQPKHNFKRDHEQQIVDILFCEKLTPAQVKLIKAMTYEYAPAPAGTKSATLLSLKARGTIECMVMRTDRNEPLTSDAYHWRLA